MAHQKVGVMTLWVEYEPRDGEFLVHRVYSHRMAVEGEGHD